MPLTVTRAPGAFQADTRIGAPCDAYQLQVDLAGNEPLTQIQAAFAGTDAEGFARSPAASFHITVLPLVDPGEILSLPTPEIWQRNGPRWLTAIRATCTETKPFMLRFTQIRYFPRALTVIADPSPITTMRTALEPRCGLPERPVRTPNITHVTLARYRDPQNIRECPNRDIPIFEIPIDRLRLIHETVYPSLGFEVIEEFRLGG